MTGPVEEVLLVHSYTSLTTMKGVRISPYCSLSLSNSRYNAPLRMKLW